MTSLVGHICLKIYLFLPFEIFRCKYQYKLNLKNLWSTIDIYLFAVAFDQHQNSYGRLYVALSSHQNHFRIVPPRTWRQNILETSKVPFRDYFWVWVRLLNHFHTDHHSPHRSSLKAKMMTQPTHSPLEIKIELTRTRHRIRIQGSSGRRHFRRPGSVSPSFPSL